jgi:hypothetical protein
MSVIISDLSARTAPVNFYAVRRFDAGTGTEIALLYAEQGTPGESSTLYLQTAALSESGTFSAPTSVPVPFFTSAVYWSEAFPRTQYPILLFAAKGNGNTAGMLVQTSTTNATFLNNGITNYLKAAVTNCGFIQVLDVAGPTSMLLIVGTENNYNPSPPLSPAVLDWQSLYPCEVPLYSGSGPFDDSFISSWFFPTDLTASLNPDCFNITFDGRITVLFNPATTSGHWAYRYQAPIPQSFSTATNWTATPLQIAASTSGSAAHAVFVCNSKATVMVIADAGQLTLYAVNLAFTSSTLVAGSVGDVIYEADYGAGMVFAYLENELVWFCNAFTNGFGSQAKNSIFRVINASNHTYTTSGLTGFNGDEMLVYAGTYGTTMYVATSNGTDVTLHSFDGTSWTVAEADIIGPTASPILDLVADIIVDGSVLITAVLATSVVCYTYTYTP